MDKWSAQSPVRLFGRTRCTQLDHVVVSRFGVFVIETKNYRGWIFGSEKQPQWTQQIYRQKNRFQNPLHQNASSAKNVGETVA